MLNKLDATQANNYAYNMIKGIMKLEANNDDLKIPKDEKKTLKALTIEGKVNKIFVSLGASPGTDPCLAMQELDKALDAVSKWVGEKYMKLAKEVLTSDDEESTTYTSNNAYGHLTQQVSDSKFTEEHLNEGLTILNAILDKKFQPKFGDFFELEA